MKLRYKILITVGLGVLYFLFQSYVFAAKPTTAVLLLDYKQYNEDYFLELLPKNTDVIYGDLTNLGFMGMTFKDAEGKYHIIVDKASNPNLKQADMTLLHEQCHIKNMVTGADKKSNFEDHGSEFQNCMINLAQHGAMKDLW